MDLHTVRARHLRELVDSVRTDGGDLSDALTALVEDLRTAVSSYLGLRLTLVVDRWPVTFTAFSALDGLRPVTSLRLGLSGLGRELDPASQVVFYAGTPGAFVNLAADFAYLHRRSGGSDPTVGDGSRSAVALDIDLPPVTVVSGFSGLTEFGTINRAVGTLIDRGQNADQAQAALYQAAVAAGVDLPIYAARLMTE